MDGTRTKTKTTPTDPYTYATVRWAWKYFQRRKYSKPSGQNV